ncbi:McrC family protein [Enterococcus hirae]|uniref:McrC family protein n=1 Tax=Enterococcus hirae TaxID=1354 RepID=UPI001E4425EA|nr:McrC family protein [Enterococcus hirae]MCD5088529.1 McrC family protein [Enterococcus hirae]UYT95868.1 McrC family protein [Enterococcus hirae]UYT97383.1 McrC family protein [Enterococcus hirae]UYU00921.1 McrC family protein [Enterococcus hirae]
MDKLLEVREFDIITCNIDYKSDVKYKYLDKKIFDELIEFIHEFAGDEGNSDVLNFMHISFKRNIGEIIVIKNHVGVIQLSSGYQIQVLPKISFDGGEDSSNKETKAIFLKMLKSMKDFPSKVFNAADLNIDKMNLYEIFINMYIQEVQLLVNRGIKSEYVGQEDNLRFFKGKLLINQQLKHNLCHKERFFVSYEDYNQNRAENRLIKSTLIKLQKVTRSAINTRGINHLLTHFEKVKPSVNYASDISKIKNDRNMRDYEIIMQWSKVFLLDKSFTTFSGKSSSRALLFPMERIYESYVAKHILKEFSPDGWDILLQGKSKHLFVEPSKKFTLKPDIICTLGERRIIMDTKWKRLINNERKNYGISQSDMYQMYAYSKKYEAPEIWLLYPKSDDVKELAKIEFDSGDGTIVNIHFVDVANIETSLSNLKRKIIEEKLL